MPENTPAPEPKAAPIQPPTRELLNEYMRLGAVDTQLVYGDSETEPTGIYAVVPEDYKLETADLRQFRNPATAPTRTTGTITVTNTASWLAYFDKHQGAAPEVYGDVTVGTVTALLNAPTGVYPAFGDHRVVLQLQPSAAWVAWLEYNGKLLGQTAFAEHLENRSPDLRTPDAATMLDLAQSFHATNGLRFESGSQLSSGQRRFQYVETVEARAGQRGDLDIPTQIEIEVDVWRGVALSVPMTARFRFRTAADGLKLGYVLDRLEDTLDAAWAELLGQLTETLPVPVLAGKAPSYGAR